MAKQLFKRKIYDQLLNWKNNSQGTSALLIEGARRVGKTCIAKEFAKKEFSHHAIIDFSDVKDGVVEAFDHISTIDIFFQRLFVSLGKKTLPKGSLIIFDEIQYCPKARQAIKKLVADGRYYYLETGSLVSIKENIENILIPSDEERIQMYPMDYEEFLWAIDYEHEVESIMKYYDNKEVCSGSVHSALMENLRIYLAVGGMPSVVATYAKTKDLLKADAEKRKILNLYEDDLRKIDNRFGTICSIVYGQIPIMLSQHSKRFLVSSLNVRSDSILFANTMDKLIESKLVIPVYKCNEPIGGFALTKDPRAFKLYFNDVGLFTSMVYADNTPDAKNIYNRLINDDFSANLGMLYENFIAQSLLAKGYKPFYYSWVAKDNGYKRFYEIDFIITSNGKTSPIEVKSSNIESLKSLDEFKAKFKKSVGTKYVIYPKEYKRNDDTIYIPFYAFFAL